LARAMKLPIRLSRSDPPDLAHAEVQVGLRTVLLFGVAFIAVGLRLLYFNGLHFSDDLDYSKRAFDLFSGDFSLYVDNNGLRLGTWAPAALGYWLFGVNDFGLVAYPLAASLASVWVVYLCARRLFDEATGLLAALLLAVFPLDVELASRLLPDVLLSAFSLIAVSLLFTADRDNLHGQPALVRRGSYLASGALLAACTVVNMSAVVLVIFFGIYFVYSLVSFTWMKQPSASAMALSVAVRRYLWVGVGYLAVALSEGLLYLVQFGDLVAKYRTTLYHYGAEGLQFQTELWHYPRLMFFIDQWRVQVPPMDGRFYGYHYLVLIGLLPFVIFRMGRTFHMCLLWLLSVVLYLQWGTMGLTKWEFLHRLPRHLEMATPAMVVVLAAALTKLPGRWGRAAAAAVVLLLVPASIQVMQARHDLNRRIAFPMQVIHRLVERERPNSVFVDGMTINFQLFLNRYESRPWRYYDFTHVSAEGERNALIFLRSDIGYPALTPAGVDANAPPAYWRPYGDSALLSAAMLPETWLRVFRVATGAVTFPREVPLPGHCRTVLDWRAEAVDGIEQIDVRDGGYTLDHVEFQPPRDVQWSLPKSVPESGSFQYDLHVDEGRGRVLLLEKPSAGNGYLLRVRLEDHEPAAAPYRFRVVACEIRE